MTKKTSDIASNLSKITKYMMIQASEPHNPIPCTTDQANWHTHADTYTTPRMAHVPDNFVYTKNQLFKLIN